MAGVLVTRRVLARQLALNAATRPLNLALPAGVVVAAILITWWLLPIAALVYAGLVVTTFLDEDVAESVGREVYARARGVSPSADLTALNPAVAERLGVAREAEQRVRRAIGESSFSFADVEGEVERLMQELEQLARNADRVAAYLAEDSDAALRRRLEQLRRRQTGDPELDAAAAQAAAALQDQLEARAQLSQRLSQFDAQIEHIVATLGYIHAQIVRASVAEETSAQRRVAERVRDLRHEVDAAADALHDAFRELD
jgi:chromosome segregation ATPase